MKSSQLSPFNQAQAAIGKVLYAADSRISEHLKTAILINLGTFTLASMQSKKERESDPLYQFSIEMAMRNLAKYVQGNELLEEAWQRAQPIFIQTLLS